MVGTLDVTVSVDDLVAHLARSIQSIDRLRLAPGDVLVISLRDKPSLEDKARILDLVRRVFDHAHLSNQVIILDDDASLSVVTPTEGEGRSKTSARH